MTLLRIPAGAWDETRAYLRVVLLGVCFTFLYNYFACLLRSVGNSVAPLAFLAVSTVLNIGLDLWFVLGLGWGGWPGPQGATGVEYLRIEGMCYCGIGILFLLYGLFRGLGRPGVSVVLTVISLGTRVALASYLLAPPHPGRGPEGHLVGRAHRLGTGRSGRAGALPEKTLPAETACAPERQSGRFC